MQGFSISKQVIGADVDLVVVSGALDAHTFEQLDGVISNLFTQQRFRLVVDMTNVNYISSAGVGILISSANETEANGGRAVLLNPRREVMEVLDELGLAEMFVTATSQEEALASF